MNIKKKFVSVALILYLALILSASNLFALPVDLNTFTPVPSWSIDISLDGSSATLYEDWAYVPVSLENWDFFIPTNASSLSFDYELNVAPFNEDYFDFYIEDPVDPVFYDGGMEGIYTGTFSYDVIHLRGQAVPIMIIFDLMANDWELQSNVTVSNVNINTVPIPEPGSFFLLGSLLIGMIGLDIKRDRRIKIYD